MKPRTKGPFGSTRCPLTVAAAAAAALCAPAAQALEFSPADGVALNWDTKLSWSTLYRLKEPSPALLSPANGGLNQDDGNRNFARGVASNRLDLFSEADVRFGDFGARLSGAAWYDAVYQRGNHNDSPFTFNGTSVPNNRFTRATRKLAGGDGELLDAFVFGKLNVGVPMTFRAGRHTLYWGETFFFAHNGIAGTQSPIDAVKALSVPSVLAKEIFRPVDQVSAQWQLAPTVALGAYVQYKWERTIIPPSGHFYSVGDVVDVGAECFIFAVPCGVPVPPGVPAPPSIARAPDLKARDSGQYGVQFKFKAAGIDWGLYHTSSHAKTPNLYFDVTPIGPGAIAFGSYRLVFHENIRAYGASFSKTIDAFQFAGEASIRHNQPLASTPGLAFSVGPPPADNRRNPAYAVGNTAHLNLSVLASLPPTPLARQASLTAELAWNRTLEVTKNPGNVESRATRDAAGLRLLLTPTYTQVLDGLDLDVPIGLGYTFHGRSSAVAGFGGKGSGDFSIGLKGTYLAVWNLSLGYTTYIGSAGNTIDAAGAATFKQAFKDRDAIALSVSTTF